MAGLLKKLAESFVSKVREKSVDYVFETVARMMDFKSILETLERNLISLTAKASDFNEQIKNGELSGKRKRKREVENWLNEVQKIESELVVLQNEVQDEGFLSRFFGGGRAAKLDARVCELVEQNRHFGELLLDAHETRGEPLLTTRLIGEAFEKNIEIIWKWVVIDKVPNIGIYGMGGVGKTTLAKHINNRLVHETQYNVHWITVAQVFAINKLQDDIANVVGLDLSNEDNEDKRAGRLNRALSQRKNFVLILDDVWADIDLDKLGYPLGVEGCRLIVTTRSLNVCRRISCREIKVETLQTDEAWNLFKETLGLGTVITSEVEEIAKSLAKECDGLPLGIIVLAGSMKRVTDIREWRNADVELKESPMDQDDMKDKVFRVLKYSFNRLDPDYQKDEKKNGYTNLQKCFLYCSLYPEDFKIDRDELITKFISEELVDKRKKRKEQFDQGHTMLNELVNLCLLESGDVNIFTRREYVKMHDLVRAMAIKIARDNPRFMVLAGLSLKKIPNEEEWAEDLEKMSLMDNHVSEIATGMSPNCPKLSTLLLGTNCTLEFIPESFFVQMTRLHVLDLSENSSIKELPKSLSDLESLNALLLKDCRNLVLVPYLGKLKELRELDLSRTRIRRLPQGMENLVNLKSLSMYGIDCLESLPIGLLPRFCYLQRLTLPLHIEICVEEIRCLKQIVEFMGSFRDVCDFNRSTKFHVDLGYPCFSQIQLGPLFVDFLTLRKIDGIKVHIHRCSLRRREGKNVIKLPADVQELEIGDCDGLSRCLLDDCDLPLSLKRLEISSCEGIECILTRNEWSMAEENEASSHSHYSPLHNLEVLIMKDLPNLISVMNWEGRFVAAQCVFTSLRELQIFNCNKLKKLELIVQDLQNIEFLSVSRCAEIVEIIDIAEEDRGGIVILPNLKRLRLDNLPKLKSICNGATIACTSISLITLYKCSKVKKLPLFLPLSHDGQQIYSPPPALEEIVIEEEMWESLEWEEPTHKHLLQPFVNHWSG